MRLAGLAFAVLLVGCGNAPKLPDVSDPNVLTAVAATVRVSCIGYDGIEIGSGSGVVINDGQILTCHHLNALRMGVTGFRVTDVTGQQTLAKFVKAGANDWMILEPLRRVGKPVRVPHGRLRRDFEEVFALGYPIGLNQMTLTKGQVQPFEGKLARISAPIAPGNSGGGAWLPSPQGKPALTGLTAAIFLGNGHPVHHMALLVPIETIEAEGGLE